MCTKSIRCHLREDAYRKGKNPSTNLTDGQAKWEKTTRMEKRVNVKAQPGHTGDITAMKQAWGSVLAS